MSRMSISHNNREFKKICLVSSAAFSAASCVWPWTAPIGASLGLYASIDSEDQPKLEEEFTAAIDSALKRTKEGLTTVDSQDIIDELSADIVRPDNVDDLISKTETYRRQYCTVLDKKRIVDMFEMYFKEEVCRCNTLSNYYLLASGTVTIETIKSVNNALIKQDKKLSTIQRDINEINGNTSNVLNLFRALLSECGFVLIAVAGCLFAALVLSVHVPFFYLHVIVCYSLSSVFSSSILKVINDKDNLQKMMSSTFSKIVSLSDMMISFLMRLLICISVSIGAYLIIVASQSAEQVEQQYETIMKQVGCVTIGCAISCCLKALPQLRINRSRSLIPNEDRYNRSGEK